MNRLYEINGKLYPSVTTALSVIRKPNLETWRGMVGNSKADKAMREAADYGQYIHEQCEAFARGEPYYNDPLVLAFVDWYETSVDQLLFVEKTVWSDKYQYAGTVDLGVILKGDDRPALLDIKSGTIWLDHALQTAAYALAANEQGIKITRRAVISLNKHHPLRSAVFKEFDVEADYDHFLYTLSLFRYFNQIEGGNLDEYSIVRVA